MAYDEQSAGVADFSLRKARVVAGGQRRCRLSIELSRNSTRAAPFQQQGRDEKQRCHVRHKNIAVLIFLPLNLPPPPLRLPEFGKSQSSSPPTFKKSCCGAPNHNIFFFCFCFDDSSGDGCMMGLLDISAPLLCYP